MDERTKTGSLPELIDRALARNRWTIRDLQRALERMDIEVSYTAVHNWVTGRSQMGVQYAWYVVRALSLDPMPFLLAAALPSPFVSPNNNSDSLPPSGGASGEGSRSGSSCGG